MAIKKLSFILALSAISFSCQASQFDVIYTQAPILSNLTNTTSVRINDDVINNYNTNRSNVLGAMIGLGIGKTFDCLFNQPLAFSLGFMGYYSDLGLIQGTEHPFANVGDFDTLNYNFNAISYSVMLEPKLVYTGFCWQPYILGGVGESWNELYDYGEQPSDPNSSAAPVPITFKNNTQSSFAYEFGLGVQRQLYTDRCGLRYFLSIDYRYINFGNAQLGGFPALTSGDHLKISRMDTQAVGLSLKISV